MDLPSPILRVTLGFLKAGRVLDNCSSVLLLGTLALPLAGHPAPLAVLGALALAATEKYFAWRVALDVEFYRWLNKRPQDAPEFDAAMGAFLSSRGEFPPRSWESRWHGSRQLVVRQAVALGLQAAAVSGLVVWVVRW